MAVLSRLLQPRKVADSLVLASVVGPKGSFWNSICLLDFPTFVDIGNVRAVRSLGTKGFKPTLAPILQMEKTEAQDPQAVIG